MQFDLLEMECMVYQAEECMECSRARPPAGTHDAVLRAARVRGRGRDAAREEAVVLRVEVHQTVEDPRAVQPLARAGTAYFR